MASVTGVCLLPLLLVLMGLSQVSPYSWVPPPPRRDGGWSTWTPWGYCSATCGRGTRARTRYCNNPTPIGEGRECEGERIEIGSCNSPVCMCAMSSWAAWGRWSPCSVTCGQGLRTRRRECRDRSCRFGCWGPKEDSEECHGVPSPCPPEWGPWSRCSAPCRGSGGFRERQRVPTNDLEYMLYRNDRQRLPCNVSAPLCPIRRN